MKNYIKFFSLLKEKGLFRWNHLLPILSNLCFMFIPLRFGLQNSPLSMLILSFLFCVVVTLAYQCAIRFTKHIINFYNSMQDNAFQYYSNIFIFACLFVHVMVPPMKVFAPYDGYIYIAVWSVFLWFTCIECFFRCFLYMNLSMGFADIAEEGTKTTSGKAGEVVGNPVGSAFFSTVAASSMLKTPPSHIRIAVGIIFGVIALGIAYNVQADINLNRHIVAEAAETQNRIAETAARTADKAAEAQIRIAAAAARTAEIQNDWDLFKADINLDRELERRERQFNREHESALREIELKRSALKLDQEEYKLYLESHQAKLEEMKKPPTRGFALGEFFKRRS